jgi:glycosyltransferase involved in cell wall biosynthesis
MVAAGHRVEWFCGSFPGALPEQDIDGVHVVRAGRQWTVHWKAFQRYRGRLRGHFDLVIDEINTMPFFTPLWANIPRLALVFQLAREVWWYESRFPISALGYYLERWYLQPYKHTPAVTISESTKRDLRRIGLEDAITVMPIGVDPIHVDDTSKFSIPSFLYVGRLTPSKRIEDIIRAVAIFRGGVRSGQLFVIGEGDARYVSSLKLLTRKLGLHESVKFLGRLPAADKHRYMAAVHALLMASVREGWGLVVTEANRCGTPAIVYDVPGLRDSVRDGKTGLIVEQSPDALAEGMLNLLNDSIVYQRLADESRASSLKFSSDESARTMAQAISTATEQPSHLERAAWP